MYCKEKTRGRGLFGEWSDNGDVSGALAQPGEIIHSSAGCLFKIKIERFSFDKFNIFEIFVKSSNKLKKI